MRKKKGQSILEYVIVLTVIVVAVAFGAKQYLGKSVAEGFNDAKDAVVQSTGHLPGATEAVIADIVAP